MNSNLRIADQTEPRRQELPIMALRTTILSCLKLPLLCGIVAWAITTTTTAWAQSGSLYGMPGQRAPLTLSDNSWLYFQPDPPRQIQINDLITVIVKEASEMASDGEVQRRQQASIDARIQDWARLDGLSLKPAPQADGDPRFRGSINGQLRTQMEMEAGNAVEFRIAARVVDIRPNGTLVLEAHRQIRNNEEVWDMALTGIVRREDVLPNNTILSEKIAELSIYKSETGHVYDGYKRGWLLRLMDRVKLF